MKIFTSFSTRYDRLESLLVRPDIPRTVGNSNVNEMGIDIQKCFSTWVYAFSTEVMNRLQTRMAVYLSEQFRMGEHIHHLTTGGFSSST